jgi:hypothetical protein
MIDKFFTLFQNGAVHKIAMLSGVCSQVIRTFDQEFAQDKDAKNAAIDTLIDLLQKHKDAPIASIPVPTQKS